jgi:hypothetical protein
VSSPTLQHTIHIRHSHFAGLVVAVAALTAATTWFASNLDDPHVGTAARPDVIASSSAAADEYVDDVRALTVAQRTAIYGNVSASQQQVSDIVALSDDERAAVYGNLPIPSGTP